jgi:RNA polymerase sigma factor (sigma-70 family)
MPDSDARLWRSWRDGADGEAFALLVRPHLGFAQRLARQAGCGAADADDVVQRSLVRLATERRDKPMVVGVRAWIGRNVLSESQMLFRARRRREAHEGRAPSMRAPRAEPSDPVSARDDVEAALRTLDADDRRVVELRYLHDRGYREIAFVEGGTVIGCRLRVHRAMKRLRKTLGGNAALAVAALPTREPASHIGEHVVARAIEAARSGVSAVGASVGSITGAVLMGTGTKMATAAALVLAAAGAWWFLSRDDDSPQSVDVTSSAAPPRPPAAPPPALAVAPTLAADPRAHPTPAAASAVSSESAGTSSIALDAPIPAGKGSVVGVVRFKDGKPLANTRLALSGSPQVVAETDAEGRFHIHGDWVGNRDLTIVGPHDYALGLGPTEMRADQRIRVEFEIDRGVTLTATVRDARTREPIADAKVKIRRPGAHSTNSMQAGFAFAKTDDAGCARFEHLPAADYTLSVVAAGHEALWRPFHIGAEDMTLDLALPVARDLIVRFAGFPAEAAGALAQWMLQAQGVGEPQSDLSMKGKATVAASGEFRIDAPPPGHYHFILFEGKSLPRIETDFDVTAEADPVVRIALPGGGRVEGVLRDREGKPMANVRLRVGDAPAVVTDEAGRFVARLVPPGKRAIFFLFEYDSVRIGEVDVPADGPASVSLSPPGSASLVATLVEPRDGGVAILQTPDGTKIADVRPDVNRRMRIPHLAAGSYLFRVMEQYATTLDKTVTLVAGRELDLGDLRLDTYPVVPVHVTFPPGVVGTPAVSVLVRERLSDPPATTGYLGSGRVEFDGEGRGWLKGLPTGEYRVVVSYVAVAQEKDLTTMDITVRAGITTPIEIVLRAK